MNKSTALIEPLGYTQSEFTLMLKRMHPTALYALADGLPFHDDGLYEQMSANSRGWLLTSASQEEARLVD